MKWRIGYVHSKASKVFKKAKTKAEQNNNKRNLKILSPKNIYENTNLLQLGVKKIFLTTSVFKAYFSSCQSFYAQ